jgi:hypothetical protein
VAALPSSIEEMIDEGDRLNARWQTFVGVVKYRVLRGDVRWNGDHEKLEFLVRGVIPGQCPLRESIFQTGGWNWDGSFSWDAKPLDEEHMPAPWDTAGATEMREETLEKSMDYVRGFLPELSNFSKEIRNRGTGGRCGGGRFPLYGVEYLSNS